MKILVDADACPVKNILEATAKQFGLQVKMFSDTSHQLHSSYSDIVVVDQGADSVDLVLINTAQKGDIIVTQDFGLAALALGKGCYAIRPDGLIFDSENIDFLLMERCASANIRRSGGKCKHIKKRSKVQDDLFKKNLVALCKGL